MKVLMVYPDYPDTFWGFKHALKFISKKASEPPLGLLTVAAMLPASWEKKVIDMKVTRLKDSDLAWADMVMISAMLIQKKSVLDVIQRCRDAGVRIVAGGPLFTKSFREFEGVDHFILYDAEATLPGFLKDLENGTPKRIYSSDEFPDLASSPVPMWELIDLKKYATVNIQYSRGCPFDCEFCDISSLFGRKVRTKESVQVLQELDKLYHLGWRGGVFFVDDNFISARSRLKKDFLPSLYLWQERHDFPFAFGTEASIDLADDDELLTLMATAGFNSVFIGIETPNADALRECNKKQNLNRDLVANVHRIQEYGMMVKGGFILGFDSDSPAVFERLSNFIQESRIITAMVGLLNAPADSRLYKRLQKENRLLNDGTGNNTDYTINFKTIMDPGILASGYRKVLENVYSAEQYYHRVRDFLRTYKPARVKFRFKITHLGALFKSIFILGIIDNARHHFWELFFWSVFRKPRIFATALTFAIYGFHFRKIFDVR